MSTSLPVISVVSPSFNGARFLPRMIASVREQRYPRLEHVFVDAASTDDTMAIVERERGHFASVTSEPDKGMYDGINRGFARTTGDVMTWLNVDDEWFPGTLHVVGTIFATLPEVEWISTALPAAIDENSALIKVNRIDGFSRAGFLRGENLAGAGWDAAGYIQQESTFWRRSLWERAGARLDDSLSAAGDFELWSRFFQHAELWCVDVPLGCYRRHASQKTSVDFGKYLREALSVFAAVGGAKPSPRGAKIRLGLRASTPGWLRRACVRAGLISPRPWITYDWGRQVWVSERR
ncbi:MAG: glycosyltransferase [Phycisphaerae bacterium]|nr:glycosyltransferase [Phycisphaerae bacterium]